MIDLLYFVRFRFESAVSIQDAVTNHGTIGWRAWRAKVTAVGPEHFAILIVFTESFVRPIPDKSTKDAIVIFDIVPVFFQVTACVASGVGIFAEHDWSWVFFDRENLFKFA